MVSPPFRDQRVGVVVVDAFEIFGGDAEGVGAADEEGVRSGGTIKRARVDRIFFQENAPAGRISFELLRSTTY